MNCVINYFVTSLFVRHPQLHHSSPTLRNRYRSELVTTTFPSFPFLKPTRKNGFESRQFFIYGNNLYTGAFYANSIFIFYLKYLLKVLNVTFHFVIELRKCSNFPHLFIMVSLGCAVPSIITSTHYAKLGTSRVMGSLQRLSCK